MTGGRFWVRTRGGHDLRRTEDAGGGEPASDPVLVGRSDGRAATITTFPWVCHRAGAVYTYALTVVGAGGVSDAGGAPVVVAAFDAAGEVIGPAPNPVRHLAASAASAGRVALRWTYDEEGEEAAPSEFRAYNDAADPGSIDWMTPVATMPYRRRRGCFAWTSESFDDGVRLNWAVRAVSANGVKGPASNVAFAVAANRAPDPPQGVVGMASDA